MKAKELVPLSKLREYVTYDAERGVFVWKKVRPGVTSGEIAGSLCKTTGYMQIGLCGYVYLQHRLAWLFVHGEWPKCHIDHIDRNKTNNKIDNLRDVDARVNAYNKVEPTAGKRLPFRGVKESRHGTFEAGITGHDGRPKYLGRFKTAEEAHAAYVRAKEIVVFNLGGMQA